MTHKVVLNMQELHRKVGAGEITHQTDLILTIYKMVMPVPWEEIEKVDGYPRCNKTTALALMDYCIRFDRLHHPNVMAGGAWMSHGFSQAESEHLSDFEVEIDDAIIKRVNEITHGS